MRDIFTKSATYCLTIFSHLTKQEEFIKRSIIWLIKSFRYSFLRRINFIPVTSIKLRLLLIIQKSQPKPCFRTISEV